jgi:hypothetical protein
MSTAPALGYEIENEQPEVLAANAAPWDRVMEMSDPPPEIDYGRGLAIRNQGNRPSCRGHSLAAVGRMGARLAAGRDIDLDENGTPAEPIKDDFSPLWCWVRTQVRGGTVGANRGATMSGGVKAATEDGFAREVDWPYSRPHTTQIDSAVVAAAKAWRFARYSTLEDEQQVHDWLASGQGACEWGKTWPLPWRGGCLADSAPGRGGGHATAIRGYWTGDRVAREVPGIAERIRAEPYVYVCENSHGTKAQWNGLYFVTRRAMADTLRQSATHLLGWSDLDGPIVRKFDWATSRLA